MAKVNRGKQRRQGQRRKQERRQMVTLEKLLDDMRTKPRREQDRRKTEVDRRKAE